MRLKKFTSFAKNNFGILLLLSTVLFAVILMQTYNFIKEKRKDHFFKTLNNIYFEKNLKSNN